MAESAKLNMGEKNVKESPPIRGSHSGHVAEKSGNFSISTTFPQSRGAYPPSSGMNWATCPMLELKQ